MKILKFGGSSVSNPERVRNVANIIKHQHEQGEQIAVVVSAMGGLTDQLIAMSKQAESGDMSYKSLLKEVGMRHFSVIGNLLPKQKQQAIQQKLVAAQEELGNLLYGVCLIRELSARTLDYILSFGERNSAYMLAEVLQHYQVPAHYLDARNIIFTDDQYGGAKVDLPYSYDKIREYFRQHEGVNIVTGFIASTHHGVTTTLGRGGSDYTASILGAALDAEEIQIWTDVSGVMTADPNKVPKAFPVASMTYQEAMEMSHFGAKVIYPPTILPALEKKIPIRIKNSFQPEAPGTYISEHAVSNGNILRGISSIDQVGMLTLEGSGLVGMVGCAARVFNAMAQHDINIILITQGSSEHSICFAVRPEKAALAKKALEKEFALEMQARLIDPVKLDKNLSILAIIGENMKSQPGISARLFQALGRNGINVVVTSQGSSERNISVAIDKKDVTKALNVVHEAFFLSGTHSLNLFIVGVGQVGGTLLEQLRENVPYLYQQQSMDIRVIALANSKKMAFHKNGFQLNNWRKQLEKSEATMDIDHFIEKMVRLNLPNSVFVDNTANEEVAARYERILEESISISTPNKIAISGSYSRYQQLLKIAEKRRVKFEYETNVGAGLPVITTLKDLINSGDRILKIEGILSGSLSFIFNSFGPGRRFSDIVREAGEKGYTEPDPRIDLNGVDVRRKLLILARQCGLALELEDIQLENILPAACREAAGLEQFFAELEAADDHFEQLRAAAAGQGQVLRYIATLEQEQATISLQAVGQDNPFFQLSGSDNMIVFTTERYKQRPLVIKGPGAGAEVTAAGVFAEIIRIGNYLA
ncbi:MAG: bifunctional aspartate kinase/homoserine dehydrogenase I [Bacteroidetes bacterium]|nr:MAG: bifunctional aspartate kinase/homoserine dehydrogenase I [Bacteroidota bacterium]